MSSVTGPSLDSEYIARATMSLEANSFSFGECLCMNRAPVVFLSFAPSPRSVSESKKSGVRLLFNAVGWNCVNSKSFVVAPARIAMAIPSPVVIFGFVVCW